MPAPSTYYHPELTLPGLLKRAASSPDNLYMGFMNEQGETVYQTYHSLLEEARLIASGMGKPA